MKKLLLVMLLSGCYTIKLGPSDNKNWERCSNICQQADYKFYSLTGHGRLCKCNN